MSWKEPDVFTLNASQKVKDILHESYYYGEFGFLRGADLLDKVGTFAFYLLPFAILNFFFILGLRTTSSLLYWTIGLLILSTVLVYSLYLFYFHGFKKFHEYWVKFDSKEKIVTLVRRGEKDWEIFDIPYEEVEDVRWVGGSNGRIELVAPGIKFYTYRAKKKHPFSPTEIWYKFAEIDCRMSDWPIYLDCPKCERRFGHHLGTAYCPFDENMILIDSSVKGRIDAEGINPEDIDRV